MNNETIMWLVILCLALSLVSILMFIGDTIVLFKTIKKLEHFDKWYKEQEKDREKEKQKVIDDFIKWYKEKSDE